jgi:hypothetical protein
MLEGMCADTHNKLQQATVWSKVICNDGRHYETQYWGYEKDLVNTRIDTVVKNIDPYRSPHRSALHMEGKFWVGYVGYYGLD